MPYPTVDWGQNLIEGLRTGAYARSLREEALNDRMMLAIRKRLAEAEIGQRGGAEEASRALAELRRGPQSEYWSEYAGYRKAQGENVDSPVDRADRAAEAARIRGQFSLEAAKYRADHPAPGSPRLGSPEMQMLNYMTGLPEDQREGALGILGDISKARNTGRLTGTKPASTFGDKTEYTKAISSIENSLSSIPALSQAGKTKFSSLSPESQEVIERYANAWTQYRLAGEFGRGTNEEYQAPPSILPVIAEILRYELEPGESEEE